MMKTDNRNMSESKEFEWENDSKSAQDLHFFLFFLENPLFLKKNWKRSSIFFYKDRNTDQFNAFTIKNDFGSVSESDEVRFLNKQP